MTLTRCNVGEALPLVEPARSWGAGRVAFYLLDMTGRARSSPNLLPSEERLVGFIDSVIKVSEELQGGPEMLVVRGNFVGIRAAGKHATSKVSS